MGKQFTSSELALYRAVDEVLHYVWDPIGVARVPEARDEYQSYLPQVYDLVRRGADAAEIANYLSSVLEYMGLSAPSGRDQEVAVLLLRWKGVIDA
jgi:hypothetical protein